MRKFDNKIATAALAVSLLTGACTGGSSEQLVTNSEHELVFEATPERNHSAGDCERNAYSWAMHTDSQPEEPEKNDRKFTQRRYIQDYSSTQWC